MTPKEIQGAAEKFRAEVGENAWLSIGIGTLEMREKPCTATLYANGITRDRTLSVEASDWPELFEALRAAWSDRQAEFRQKTIRKMAMEIIRLTADMGECTDAALRGAKFTAEEVARYGAEAVAEADRLAGNGPFGITFLPQSNAA